jgi:hypothetical protein
MKKINKTQDYKIYKNNLVRFKKVLREYFNQKRIDKRIYNLVLVKIKKSKCEEIDKYLNYPDADYRNIFSDNYRIEGELWISSMYMYLTSKKLKMREKNKARIEMLSRPKYIEKLYLLGNFDNVFLKDIVKQMTSKQIKMYEMYYDLFVNIFIELDQQSTTNIVNNIFGGDCSNGINIYSLIGLHSAWYEYPRLKEEYGIDTWFLDEETKDLDEDPTNKEKLRIFIHGYGYYKMGIFNIFKEKWRFECS